MMARRNAPDVGGSSRSMTREHDADHDHQCETTGDSVESRHLAPRFHAARSKIVFYGGDIRSMHRPRWLESMERLHGPIQPGTLYATGRATLLTRFRSRQERSVFHRGGDRGDRSRPTGSIRADRESLVSSSGSSNWEDAHRRRRAESAAGARGAARRCACGSRIDIDRPLN
jgi:hypothetical protein